MVDYSIDDNFRFFDKDTYPPKRVTINDGVRIVPGGTTAREGAYLGQWRDDHASGFRQRRGLR